ncbi:MAG: hypothetical protein ABSC55_12985 [Syntrophorhabdales bacterium]|jgi:hypothetical protein
MGRFLAVNGGWIVLLALIGVALVASAASRCSGYLLRKARPFFSAAKGRPLRSLRSSRSSVAT